MEKEHYIIKMEILNKRVNGLIMYLLKIKKKNKSLIEIYKFININLC